MFIKQLELYHFGKFHNYTLELGPGMNVIYGSNESGKSTIHAFIQSMFFGVARMRGRAAANDDYTRYQPWQSENLYEGQIIFSYQNQDYRLYRNFFKATEKVHLTELASGREISLVHGKISDFIPELTEDIFNNTVSVRQLAAATDQSFAQAFGTHLANLGSTGSEGLDLKKADDYLKRIQSQLKKDDLHQDIALKTEKLQTMDEKLLGINRLLEQLQSLKHERIRIEQKLTADNRQQQTKKAQAERKQQQLIEIKQQIDAAEAAAKAIARVSKPEVEARAMPHRSFGFSQRLGIGVLLIAMLILLLVYYNQAGSIWLLLAGISGAAVLIICLFQALTSQMGPTPEPEPKPELEYPPEDTLAKLRKDYNFLFKEILALSTELNVSANANQCNQQLQAVTKQYNRCEWELEQLLELQAGREDLAEQIKQLKAKQQNVRKEQQAIELSRKLLTEAAKEIHENLGQYLEHEAETVFGQISGQPHALRIDHTSGITVDTGKHYVDMDRLSAGAMDQIYFALRLSFVRRLFAGEDFPLILDDLFALYDDQRLHNQLEWLDQHFYGQILLFTCHHREADALELIGRDYNYIELDNL